MVVTEVQYSKKVLSKTDANDVSYHGSPTYEYFQTTGKEDLEIREEITEKFSIKTHISHSNSYREEEGFDGKNFYIFNFSGKPKTLKNDEKKNVEYDAIISIKKAGNKKDLENLCDLEEFLIEKGFRQVKN